jgi:dTDP-glucose 4,6-dehydratase
MKVLITGGAGFIAHHVIENIIRTTDWQIICLDRLDLSGNLNRLADVMEQFTKEDKARVKIVFHDLKAELNPMIQENIGQIDMILHLAAGSHVDRSIIYPMEFVMDNVVGTVNLLQFARTQINLKKFVYFSTDEVFGSAPKGVSFKEWDRYNSTNPYSASKAAGEEMCVAFENTYGLPIIVTHTMNVFGERQHPEKFIPLCIKKIRDGETVMIHANEDKTEAGTRHYIHAKDVAEGLRFILDVDTSKLPRDFGGGKCPKFNLVGPEEVDNLSLAKMIADVQGRELKYEMVDFHNTRPGHDLRYAMSGELLKSLGWEPKIKFSERIKEVVEWTLSNDRWLHK